jgi:Ca2+-binding RTX toxin-like protein
MNKLNWSGTIQAVTMIDPARPDRFDDDVTQVLTGITSDVVWTAGTGNGKIVGTGGNDLVFLDNDITATPLLDNIVTFTMGKGDDVVDLTSNRFTYGRVKIDGGDGNDWLFAGAGNDKILGGAGEDRLKGGDGNDKIISGADRDYLAGGAGKDTFYFTDHDGRDNIYDFTPDGKGHDVIDLSAATSKISDFNDLMNNHVLVENGELKITLDDGNYIRLYGLQPSDLQAQDFHF